MKYLLSISIVIVFFLSLSTSVSGQQNLPAPKDTTKSVSILPIELSEIPIMASELKMNIDQKIMELISDESIRRIDLNNQKIITSIDRSLFSTIDPNDSITGIRYLSIRQNELKLAQKRIEDQKNYLAGIIRNVDSVKYALISESERWKLTQNKLMNDSTVQTIPVQLNSTINYLDSIVNKISAKSSILLGIIDKTIATGVRINTQTEKNKALIDSKQSNIFQPDHSTLLNSALSANFEKEFRSLFSGVLKGKIMVLLAYLLNNLSSVLLSLLCFSGFYYLLKSIRKKVNMSDTGFGYFYKDKLNRLIYSPLSSTFILTLFFSQFIFIDRPQIFKEFLFYLVAFPLIHSLNVLFDQKYTRYTKAYGVLVFIYMFVLFLPTELFFYRLLLLMIAVCETVIIAIFLHQYHSRALLPIKLKRVFFYFVVFHLLLAVIGIFSNVFGRLILSEITVSAVFFNVFNGLVLVIVAILINGLVTTGIDSVKGQQLHIFQEYGNTIKQKVIYLVNTFTIIYWIMLIMRNFRISELFYDSFKRLITHKISIGSASFSLDDFIIFFLVIYAFNFISKILRIVLEKDILSRFKL